MSTKKTAPSIAYVIHKFADGSVHRMPWVDQEAQLLSGYARMLTSEDHAMRADGHQALRRVAQEMHDLKMALYVERLRGAEISEKRSDAGKKGAEARWQDRDPEVNERVQLILAALAMEEDSLGDPIPTAELWTEFFGRLDAEGLGPREEGFPGPTDKSRVTWEGGGEGLSFKTFRNRLSEARRVIQ